MSSEQITSILAMLKVDLGIMQSTAYDSRLSQIIQSAYALITREGATLDADDLEDAELIVMYAAYLWRKRDKDAGMPRMLRWALNNRIFSEKAQNE